MKNRENSFFKDYVENDLNYKHFEFIKWFVDILIDDVYTDIVDDIYGELEVMAQWVIANKIDYANSGIVDIWLQYKEMNRTQRFVNTKLKSLVLAKFDYKCTKCGSVDNIEIDHIFPYSKGGKTVFNNLTVLCKTCNLIKTNKV